ncbi:MAG TPA: formylglycine-generating enzyme family protein, partial [Gemmataceae bacterium]|nr:formylglycine-generating enzyme family protein [Gemmataceae bacterium]
WWRLPVALPVGAAAVLGLILLAALYGGGTASRREAYLGSTEKLVAAATAVNRDPGRPTQPDATARDHGPDTAKAAAKPAASSAKARATGKEDSPRPPIRPAVIPRPEPLDCTGVNEPTAADVRQAQEAWAKYLRRPVEETVEGAGGVKLTLVLVPPGKFRMGSPKGEEGRFDDEKQHEVEITQAFYLGKYDVTRGQFRAFAEDDGYKTEAETDGLGGWGYDEAAGKFKGPLFDANTGKHTGGETTKYSWRDAGFPQTNQHPVVNVSWNDAQAFCRWLARRSGKAVRLPTEAEWEYACRAGTRTRYYSGDDAETLAQVGNVADGTAKKKFPNWQTISAEDGYVFTAPVGSFRPNGFGLYDMHGNVWQWCQDRYGQDYYQNSPKSDPQGTDNGLARVLRGGSWINRPKGCRAAHRSRYAPAYSIYSAGFRVAFRLE